MPLLNNLLDQLALALERARLEAESREVAELRERDRLRSALLSSVGHDLRTPLTAIIAAASELGRDKIVDDALLATVGSEATKLERYIANLLDMARIEAGAVGLKTEPVDVSDVPRCSRATGPDVGALSPIANTPFGCDRALPAWKFACASKGSARQPNATIRGGSNIGLDPGRVRANTLLDGKV